MPEGTPDRGHPLSPQCGSHPSKNIPRQQPFHVTVAVAFLTLPPHPHSEEQALHCENPYLERSARIRPYCVATADRTPDPRPEDRVPAHPSSMLETWIPRNREMEQRLEHNPQGIRRSLQKPREA